MPTAMTATFAMISSLRSSDDALLRESRPDPQCCPSSASERCQKHRPTIAVINPSKRIPTVRYYEIAERSKVPTANDHTVRSERHLQHDAGQVLSSGGGLWMSGNA